jgi:ribonuclease M5
LIKIKEAVIVEGKYDKIKLSSVIDGLIIETNGFQIFSDKKQMDLIRRLADTRGLLILTDSDGAGFMIRNYLTGSIAPEKIKHAYIPDILGKEKRKDRPSKEGKLGVEGVPVKIILDALKRAGVTCGDDPPAGRKITKTDLYLAGLSGSDNSAEKRRILLQELSLPEHLPANSLVGVLNSIMSYEEFQKLLDKLFKKSQN